MKNEYEIRGDITAIFIKHKGITHEALIDTVDLPLVDSFSSWFAKSKRNNNLYIATEYIDSNGKRTYSYLHRVITNAPSHLEVDHIYNDSLDNRKSQLRLVTPKQNSQNRKALGGVSWNKNAEKWSAYCWVDGKKKHLGYFFDKEEAQKVAFEAKADNHPFSKEARILQEAQHGENSSRY